MEPHPIVDICSIPHRYPNTRQVCPCYDPSMSVTNPNKIHRPIVVEPLAPRDPQEAFQICSIGHKGRPERCLKAQSPGKQQIVSSPLAGPTFFHLDSRTVPQYHLCTTSSTQRQKELHHVQSPQGLEGAWSLTLGDSYLGHFLDPKHRYGSPWENTQEITQTTPKHTFGDPYQHCCRTARIPSRVGHHPQR